MDERKQLQIEERPLRKREEELEHLIISSLVLDNLRKGIIPGERKKSTDYTSTEREVFNSDRVYAIHHDSLQRPQTHYEEAMPLRAPQLERYRTHADEQRDHKQNHNYGRLPRRHNWSN